MTTSVSICNLALARCGVKQSIASLTEQSENARSCNLFYDQSRQALLREIPWSFAERFHTLALVSTTETGNNWAYSYRYPADAVRVNYIVDQAGSRIPNPPVPFKLGSDSQGRLVYCDYEDAVCSYNHNITDVSQFDSLFVDTMAWRIATELAPFLSRDANFSAKVNQDYFMALRKAAAAAMNEEGQEEWQSSLSKARD